MKFHFENKNGNLDISANYKPKWSPYIKRVETVKRFGKDGEAVVGDEQVNGRKLDFTADLIIDPNIGNTAAKDAAYAAVLNELVGFFLKDNAPFYAVEEDTDIRTQIRLTEITDDPKFQGGEKRLHTIQLKFKMIDAYWEDQTEISQVELMISGNTVIINNDSLIDTFPLIEIVPANVNSDFLILNETTGDSFVLGSLNFDPAATFFVDSQNGTIFLFNGISTVENSISLADGSGFIKFASGDNTILYESAFGDSTLTFKHRRRFAF